MAEERIFRPGGGGGGTAMLPTPTADSFGAGVGQGIARLGGALHEKAVTDYRIAREAREDQEASGFASQFAAFRSATDQKVIDMQAGAQPGGAGHADAVKALVDDPVSRETLLGGIKSDRLRKQATAQIEDYAQRVTSREYGWQAAKTAVKTVTDAGDAIGTMANTVRNSPDPNSYADESKHLETFVQSLAGIDEDQRAKISKEGHGALAISHVQGLIDKGDAAPALALIKAGAFNEVLEPRQIEQLSSAAEVQMRIDASQAKAAAAQAKTEEVERLSTIKAGLSNGSGNPTGWYALADGYEKIGDTSGAVEARAKGDEAKAAIAFRAETPAELDRQIASLNALEAKQGGLTAEQAQTRAGIQGVRNHVRSLLAQSPMLAMSFATGKAPPSPIDWNDPASIQGRLTAARAAAQQYRQLDVKPLLPDEVSSLGALYRKEGGKSSAIDALQLLGDDAGSAARQVAPDDNAFIHLADLAAGSSAGRSAAADALAGDQVLKTNKGVFPAPVKADAEDKWRAIAPMFATMPSLGNAIYVNARAIYAAESLRAGQVDQTELDAVRWARAVDRAAGGDGRDHGGISSINGNPVLVPEGMDRTAFADTISRAGVADWMRAGGGRTALLGGRAATLAEIRQAVPVAIGGGRYALRIGNGRVTNREGQPWTFDVAKLGHR